MGAPPTPPTPPRGPGHEAASVHQHLRDQQAHLFQPGLSMQQFMWQPDLAGVAKFVADGLDILRLD